MAEPKALKEVTPYIESPKGTICVNMDGEIRDDGIIGGWEVDGIMQPLRDPKRNLCGCAYIPDGKAFEVVVECDGERFVVVSGISKELEPSKKFCLMVRARANGAAKVPRVPNDPEKP